MTHIDRFTFGLTTEKLSPCRDFYVRLFDFRVVFEQSWFVHLRSSGDACDLALLKPGVAELPEAFRLALQPCGAWISFNVSDVEAVRDRCLELNVPLEFDLQDQPWGERHFAVRDPAGVLVNVAQKIPPSGDYARSTGKAST